LDLNFTTNVPADLQAVPDHRNRFVEWLAQNGVDEAERQPLQLIFDELVNNSVEHGCNGPEDAVAVASHVTDGKVEILVYDPGEGKISGDSFPHGPNGVFEELGRGAGLILVRAFSDEIHVERGPNGGTMIRAVKYRTGAPS